MSEQSAVIKLAVFDCDGTLCDGQAAVCTAMEQAFAKAALPCPPRAQIRRIVGLSLPQAIAQIAPDASHETQSEIIESYKAAFRAARMDGSLHEPLFEGIADLLRKLSQSGWTLGVATGKSDRGLKATLETHGISDLFSTLHTADRHPSKPHPAMLEAAMEDTLALPKNTVMIGDTVFDIEMAKNAGTRAIGVNWGYHEPEELIAYGAQDVARDMRHLEELIG